MKQVVAIHQPNFFPWLGYFDKIARSDAFVLLDHVQISKTGGVWCNRVKMLIGDEARWVTAPISRAFHGTRRVCEIEFEARQPWRTKLLKSLTASYARAAHFRDTIDFLEPLILNPENNLARYNAATVRAIARRLGRDRAEFLLSSDIETAGQSNLMLAKLVKAAGARTYLCGGGSAGYQDDEVFAAEGVEVIYQQFEHPVYPQVGDRPFVPGLSIVDALMNCGFAEVAGWLPARPAAQQVE